MSARPPWWFRAAGHPLAPLALVLVTVGLGLPAFRVGLLLEDFVQRGLLAQESFDPILMFRLARNPEELAFAQRLGIAPWWSDPELRMAFFRPLSVFTHRLDWRWWPGHPTLRILHTFAWWAASAAGAWFVHRRLLPSRAAAVLATFAWAADDARGMAVGWLANRNTFVACAFGFAAIAAHLRWRERRTVPDLAAAVVLLGLALCSAEAGVGAAAYLLAAAVVLEDRASDRVRALLPYGVVAVPWVVVWKALGFGTHHSGMYTDPVGEPLTWLGDALRHGPVLWASQWTGPVALAYAMVAPPWNGIPLAVGLAVTLAVGTWLRPIVAHERRMAFALLGSLLALLPVTAVFPNERVLGFVGLGASAILGQALHTLATRPVTHARPWRIGTRVLGALGLWVGPGFLPLSIDGLRSIRRLTTDPWEDWATDDPTVASAAVVSMTAPCVMCSAYLPWIRQAQGRSAPTTWRAVAASWDRVEVERVDARTLRVTPEHGFGAPPGTAVDRWGPVGAHLLGQQLDSSFGDGSHPSAVGWTVDVGVFVATVTALTPDGRPGQADLRFREPLGTPAIRLTRLRAGRMEALPLPAVGETVVLEPEFVPFP